MKDTKQLSEIGVRRCLLVLLALFGAALEESPFGGVGNIPEKNSMHGTGGWTSYCIILERP